MSNSIEHQNPLYPDDRFLTDAQMQAEAREISLQRAISPGPRLCLVDSTQVYYDPNQVPPHVLSHSYTDYMNYRFNHVIGPQQPWTNWSLYDDYPFPPTPTTAPAPPGPVDWNARSRVNPHGISQMDRWDGPGWEGYTFATQVGASTFIPYGAGTETRITLICSCVFGSVFIGPATTTPFVASQLFQLTFGGNASGADSGYPDWILVSDPLPQGIDATNGVIVSGYVQSHNHDPSAWLATRGHETDWYARWAYGNMAATLDKSKLHSSLNPSGWIQAPFSSAALLMIEAYYPPTVVTPHRRQSIVRPIGRGPPL